MFTDISRHILDICRNSVCADASLIEIKISVKGTLLSVEINDDGKGISETDTEKILDPFYTTKISGKTGLGLPLFRQAALTADGSFEITLPEKGMCVKAVFDTASPDCMPVGQLKEDISAVVLTENAPDIVFEYQSENTYLKFDTRSDVQKTGSNISVWKFIRDYLGELENLPEIGSCGKNYFRNKEEKHEN